ncbi:DEAD/DEAH box helicase [Roseivirga sp. UBA838]|uniref:DEAD/DEAH box helicase n=1 Tax=Roseivirga sp. UBA838 TaxID=1947393 RepID=UPI00257AAC1B|nr:DEAD/DEAH box helicase [Roseivirga sp. UBA838]
MNYKKNRADNYASPSSRSHTLRSRKPLSKVKKRQSSISDFDKLVKTASEVPTQAYQADRCFNEMPLSSFTKKNLSAKGYVKPSQIQDDTLESLLAGKDLVGIASTGSGKTAAFLIPVIERLIKSPKSNTALIVVPTRELALQTEQEFKSLACQMNIFCACFIGGTKINKDLRKLQQSNHVIIATPGRLRDLVNQRALSLDTFQMLILDEFDRMLDMGFVHDIRSIVKDMTSRKQTMLFSATLEPNQKAIINEIVRNPEIVKVDDGESTNSRIDEDIIHVPEGADKMKVLIEMISGSEFSKVLLFTETKRWADRVSKKLNQSGVKADAIHGNKSQNYRNAALLKFKNGGIQVLVATDVASRGIDVHDVTHVINYHLPLTYQSYIHRVGRTGRAGRSGKAFTFIN